ncbi:hypothetical protein [Mesobacillus subterraneus]|nr:hypothetical protein [Mesobacillus subterraneus]
MDPNKRPQEESSQSNQEEMTKNEQTTAETDGFRYDYDDSSDVK